jgi:pleiotropic regulator 1
MESKRDEKAKTKVKEAIQKGLSMFLGDIGKKTKDDEYILKKKIELKTQTFNSLNNEIPDYLIGERKRRKILEDLGVEYRKKIKLPEDIVDEEEKEESTEQNNKENEPNSQTDEEKESKHTSDLLSVIEEEKKQKTFKSMIPDKFRKKVKAIEATKADGKVVPYQPQDKALDIANDASAVGLANALFSNRNAIVLRKQRIVEPEWHAPWKLKRVISGHQGWVRAIAVDVSNRWFVTGSRDRTIKFWDLVEGTLKLTLTGHISTVRGLCVSDRHPYLFSCGEDKQVMCWDLEQNKVVRKYHGHLSGVYSIALHPSLDLLITGSRDSTCRVWDMRTKAEVHCLTGHSDIVSSIITQDYEPQVITGSHDKMVKLWDIGTGRKIKTLTYHKKSIRAMAMHHEDYTF